MASRVETGVDYGALKVVHQSAVALSFAGFFARGLGMLGEAAWIRTRLARTLPHVVDTILLASAIGLVYLLDVNPFRTPWLAAKIVGLLVYIVLGGIALRYGRSKGMRVAAWIAALLTFVYIVSVAITKNAAGFLG
jgi:uncharacterized membrane protein SirB2